MACMQAKSICICTYDGIKVGSPLAMQAKQCKMRQSLSYFMLVAINAMMYLK